CLTVIERRRLQNNTFWCRGGHGLFDALPAPGLLKRYVAVGRGAAGFGTHKTLLNHRRAPTDGVNYLVSKWPKETVLL
ncbi:MAG: hypothetical protein WA821_15985, partial [Anaerolineales bacterium]